MSASPLQQAPLAGLRVLDLSGTLMGPYCSQMMAAMGADVLKIEPPEGDVLRGVADARRSGVGPLFVNANRGKRSLAIDLKHPEGRRVLAKLAEGADVLLHNMRPEAAARLGLDPAAVCARHPRLIFCAIPGFGSEGPYRDQAAYDDVIQAITGLAAVQGGAGEPQYVRTVIADKVVALQALTAILAALVRRGISGRGGALEVPMFEAMTSFLLLEQQGGMVYDPPRGPTGYARTKSPYRKPYATRDGFLGVLVYTDKQWLSFFQLIGRPELARDPLFVTIQDRTENIDQLYQLVEETLPARTSAEWIATLGTAGIPCTPISTIAGLFDDPHLAAVGFFERVEHPTEGTMRLGRSPLKFADTERLPEKPAPRLGEDSRQVLRECGLDDAAIEALVTAGVVVIAPGA